MLLDTPFIFGWSSLALLLSMFLHHGQTSLRGTVILFHGNAMNHGDLVEPHAVTFHRLGFTVLTAEYRG